MGVVDTHRSGSISQPDHAREAQTIFGLAAASRAMIICGSLLSDAIVSDYDTSATLKHPCLPSDKFGGGLDAVFSSRWTRSSAPVSDHTWFCNLLERKIVWDSVYFVRIAECGYEYEQTHAFFPMLPLLMRACASTVLRPLSTVMSLQCRLALSGLLISNLSFIASTVFLYYLTLHVTSSPRLSKVAAVFYTINPASIFHSAIYTESLFGLFTFAGLLARAHGRGALSAVLFAAGTGTRANGILLCGHTLLHALQYVAPALLHSPQKALRVGAAAVVESAVIVAPLVAHQAKGWAAFCRADAWVTQQWVTSPRPWCAAALPNIYSFIQAHYWNNGLLKYFRPEQVPNFLLAGPMVALSSAGVYQYAKHNPLRFWSANLVASFQQHRTPPPHPLRVPSSAPPASNPLESQVVTDTALSSFGLRHRAASSDPIGPATTSADAAGLTHAQPTHALPNRGKSAKADSCRSSIFATWINDVSLCEGSPSDAERTTVDGFYSDGGLGMVYQWAIMLLLGVLVMNVQVTTRFLSCCPPLYWYTAHVWDQSPKWGRALAFYFVTYMFVGTVLFTNFYPWT